MNEYHIEVIGGDNVVTICMNHECDFLNGFLDIYLDDEDAPSPFKTLEDAKVFAYILVKILKVFA